MDAPNNAVRMARQAVCDGIRLIWRDVAQDEVERRLNLLAGYIDNNTDASERDKAEGFKVKCVRGSADPRGSYWSVQLTGEVARVVPFLPWSWAVYASAVHMKVWCDEVYQGAHDAFADAIYNSTGRLDSSFFGNNKNTRSKKKSGHKGVRLGSKKSDLQTVTYKRQGERSGHEARVKGDMLFRIWCEATEAAGDIFPNLSDKQVWNVYLGKAARVGFTKYLAELRVRGVKFTDYFSTAASAPEGALEDGRFHDLDSREDAID